MISSVLDVNIFKLIPIHTYDVIVSPGVALRLQFHILGKAKFICF